jgi:hypothetical protein
MQCAISVGAERNVAASYGVMTVKIRNMNYAY